MHYWKVVMDEALEQAHDSDAHPQHHIQILDKRLIYASPQRDLHGPSCIRAQNGDILLCHQDSQQHLGGDGYVHQWRSVDNGLTWQDEGPLSDWRSRGIDALFGEYGLLPNGKLVAFIQRRVPRRDDDGIRASWYALSSDHGKHWKEIGPVSTDEQAFLSPRNVIRHKDFMYVTAWSPHGHALYVSANQGTSWRALSTIFTADDPLFPELRHTGPPFYPHIELCPDGSMLAMSYYTPQRNVCYSRHSYDMGLSWTEVREETDLPIWAPRMRRISDRLMLLTGRDYKRHSTVACLSNDNGHCWSPPVVLDTPRFKGSYAYTDSIVLDATNIMVFTSSPQSEGRGDIMGIRITIDTVV